MSTTIICPQCSHQFEPTDAIAQSIEKEMRGKMEVEWRKRMDGLNAEKQVLELQQRELENRMQQQEEELKRRVEAERKQLEGALAKEISEKVQGDFAVKLRALEDANREQDAKLNEARQKELDFLKKMQELQAKEQELELEMQRRMLEERGKLSEQIKKEEEEKNKLRDLEHDMKIKELEKQLDDQRKLADEMKRKAEQKSMQLQGEVQELALEELLRSSFPFDIVSEVGKGVRGADCIQTVRNSMGQECGKIIYESKRTKDFGADWIEKLKADMRSQDAEVAVIVTQAMPKGMDCFGEKDGVWICSFGEVSALAGVLRDLIIRVYKATRSEENKGDKMALLYRYLTSSEFTERWKTIREVFYNMKTSIQTERDAMERLWKSREKQLEKALLSVNGIRGSIDGIAGMNAIDLGLEEGNGHILE
ncbi:MAG: DUF2130 domain-containing protein [Bacteroidetes bacterium]|nr:DUF2130 domain-containing protein [Bacteroidota bacterium]